MRSGALARSSLAIEQGNRVGSDISCLKFYQLLDALPTRQQMKAKDGPLEGRDFFDGFPIGTKLRQG